MGKKKPYPYRLGHPKTPVPMKEMSWAETRHIRISCQIQGFKNGGQWEQGNKYKLTVMQGDRYSETGYDYTKDDVVDAIYDAYRKLYNTNNGKETKE